MGWGGFMYTISTKLNSGYTRVVCPVLYGFMKVYKYINTTSWINKINTSITGLLICFLYSHHNNNVQRATFKVVQLFPQRLLLVPWFRSVIGEISLFCKEEIIWLNCFECVRELSDNMTWPCVMTTSGETPSDNCGDHASH